MASKKQTYEPLTETQLKILLDTPYGELIKVFQGYSRRFLISEKKRAQKLLPPSVHIDAEAANRSRAFDQRYMKRQVQTLIEERETLREEMDALRNVLDGRGYRDIVIPTNAKKHEATVVALASDWHYDEVITKAETNGLNWYNKEVAERRCDRFFANLAELVKKEQRAVTIRNGVLWLGGDFISGHIHEELMETNRLGPVPAAIEVQAALAGGIRYLLEHTDLHWSIPCSVGNHERITPKRRVKTAIANSLGSFIYYGLAAQFMDEKRITFHLPDAYFTYLDIHGQVCRFHHGDAVRYYGGIGGIHIPLRKKIAQWNRSRRADIDFHGHLHTLLDGGHYLSNGSMNGYNSYAISIGAEYERPQQMFCLIDSKHGKTGTFPILVAS